MKCRGILSRLTVARLAIIFSAFTQPRDLILVTDVARELPVFSVTVEQHEKSCWKVCILQHFGNKLISEQILCAFDSTWNCGRFNSLLFTTFLEIAKYSVAGPWDEKQFRVISQIFRRIRPNSSDDYVMIIRISDYQFQYDFVINEKIHDQWKSIGIECALRIAAEKSV